MASTALPPYSNPARIVELFAPLSTGDLPAFFMNTVSEHVKHTLCGTHRFARTYTREAALRDVLTPLLGMFATPLYIDVDAITGGIESPWAAVEAHAREGTILKDGMVYNQTFVFVVKFEGEQIVELREYLDTNLFVKAMEGNLGSG